MIKIYFLMYIKEIFEGIVLFNLSTCCLVVAVNILT